jgi:hypothetical protein
MAFSFFKKNKPEDKPAQKGDTHSVPKYHELVVKRGNTGNQGCNFYRVRKSARG